MINLTDISKSFGDRPLFQGVNLRIGAQDRVGLVGTNGSGKTTLFRVIAGEMSPDSGEVTTPRGTRVGYLRQELNVARCGLLKEEVLDGMPGYQETRRNLAALQHTLVHDSEGREEAVLEEMADLQQQFDRLGGEALENRAKAIMAGLGFGQDQFMRPVQELSGGWRMRAELARLLVGEPDILLLDEPTNHLDMESMIWFENHLSQFRGGLVLVAHDREFLNRVVNRIVEVDRGRIKEYSGDYDKYREQKEEDERLHEKRYKDQQVQIRMLEDFISRNRVRKDRARQAQVRMRQLEAIERLEAPRTRGRIHFEFPQPARSGANVLSTTGLGKSYDTKVVFKGLELRVARGEKIALVGFNGAGKSTLLKIVAGRVEPTSGELELGYNVQTAYYAQHQLEELDPDLTVFEELVKANPEGTISETRSLLGAFRFSGEDVDKKVAILSGGEKSRLALAKLLVRPANLMLMDEPTNHLDIESREVLEDAMRQYEGTLLFTSHDRRFINAVASKVIELEHGVMTEYPGNYSYYEWKKRQNSDADEGREKIEPSRDSGLGDGGETSARERDRLRKRREAAYRQALHRELGPLKKKTEDLEARITRFETQLAELEEQMADPTSYDDPGKTLEFTRKHAELKAGLEKTMAEWEDCCVVYEEGKARIDMEYDMC